MVDYYIPRRCPDCGSLDLRRRRVRSIWPERIGYGGSYSDCPVAAGGCGWTEWSDTSAHARHADASQVLRAAPLPVAIAAVELAEAELQAAGANVAVYRRPRHRIALGQFGVGAARVAALRNASATAARITTGMRGANAYRIYFPVSVVQRAAEILGGEG